MQPSNGSNEKIKKAGLDNPATPGLFAMLALRQHRINQAVGIGRVTPQVQIYLACYIKSLREQGQADQFNLFWASFLNTIIQDSRNQIKQLLKEAEAMGRAETFDQKRLAEIASEVDRFQKIIADSEARLKAI